MKAKKIKSIAITAIMALSSLTALPMSASAITDPNGDGSVNATDALIIQYYLSGTTNYSNLTALDFNGDMIIDEIDKSACLRYITTGTY